MSEKTLAEEFSGTQVDFLMKGVWEVPFLSDVKRLLLRNNISYMFRLVQNSEDELLSLKGFGKKSLAQVKSCLDNQDDLHLGMDLPALKGVVYPDEARRVLAANLVESDQGISQP